MLLKIGDVLNVNSESTCAIGSKSAMQVGKLLHTVSHCLLLMHECDMVPVSAGIVVRCGETVTGK